MGMAVDGGFGGGDDWLAGYRIHRSRRHRRTLRRVAQPNLAPCHRRAADGRYDWLLPARRADGARYRPVRTCLLCRRLGCPSEPCDVAEGCCRLAVRQPRIRVSDCGDYWCNIQPMDDLLSAVRHRRQTAEAGRHQGCALGYRCRRRSYPMLDRRRPCRRCGGADVGWRPGKPDQRRPASATR